jgi:hypothetical protein
MILHECSGIARMMKSLTVGSSDSHMPECREDSFERPLLKSVAAERWVMQFSPIQ